MCRKQKDYFQWNNRRLQKVLRKQLPFSISQYRPLAASLGLPSAWQAPPRKLSFLLQFIQTSSPLGSGACSACVFSWEFPSLPSVLVKTLILHQSSICLFCKSVTALSSTPLQEVIISLFTFQSNFFVFHHTSVVCITLSSWTGLGETCDWILFIIIFSA